jgi:hypothetical protein
MKFNIADKQIISLRHGCEWSGFPSKNVPLIFVREPAEYVDAGRRYLQLPIAPTGGIDSVETATFHAPKRE